MEPMALGDRIRMRREELALSRIQLADRLGVTPSTVSNYETGVSFPKEEVMLRLFDCLETDPNTLFQDSFRQGGDVLNQKERQLLAQYRALSPLGRESVQAVLEAVRLADWTARYVREGTLPPCPLDVQAGNGVGHTIPQKISGTEDVRLSLRVRAPFRDGSIVVRQNGREVVRKSMKKALPAEMIWLEIPADRLDRQGDLEVCAEW